MKTMCRIIITLTLLLFCMPARPYTLVAQEIKEYPLEALIRTAMENYRLLEIKKSEIAQKEALSMHEKRWDNPEAGATLGSKKTGSESGLAYSVTLSQKLPLWGKKGLAAGITKLEGKEAEIDLEEIKLALRYEITRLAYEYSRDLMKKKHIRERLQRIKLANAYMHGHIQVSPQRIVERNIVQAKLKQMEMEFLEIHKNIKMSYNALNRYLKFPGGENFKVSIRWFAHAPVLSFEDLLLLAEKGNYDIRRREVAVARAEKELDLAKREVLPDIGVSLFYHDDTMNNREQIFGGGVIMPLPLLSRNTHAVKKGSLNAKAQELTLLQMKESLSQKLRELHAEYEYAAGLLALFPLEKLDTLEEKMDYADAEFRKGRITLVTYLEMDNTLHENIESVYHAQLSMVRVYTELLFLSAVTKQVEGDLP